MHSKIKEMKEKWSKLAISSKSKYLVNIFDK